jgi:glyoxylase-like metal-dependent hydrolase (beta-lactamase superfamily II)
MARHGVPAAIIEDNEEFWEFQRENGADFVADVRLADGDEVRAGGRTLRVVSRPGHSTTDTLFVDDESSIAFVGDHLLARISSNTEIYPPAGVAMRRPPSRAVYLQNLGLTAAMDLHRLHTGHGEDIPAPAGLVRRRLAEHRRRCKQIVDVLDSGESTAYRLAEHLWSKRTTRHQPLLVVWEVLGHLELLEATGSVAEHNRDDGQIRFALTDGDEWVKVALSRASIGVAR